MSILIKGMKMPKEGQSVVVDLWNHGEAYVYGRGNAEMYEAVELPDHGGLIDKRELMREFARFVRRSNNSDFAPVPNWNDAVSLVGSAPVVIPAERSEDATN